MTTRKLAFLTIGFASLAALSLPAIAGDWSFGFGFGYGYDRPCYRPYFARSYVYSNYCAPAVVYQDCNPDVVVYDAPPAVTYYRSYCGPTVVYGGYAPRYFSAGVVVGRSYPAVRAYHAPYYSVRSHGYYAAPHARRFWH